LIGLVGFLSERKCPRQQVVQVDLDDGRRLIHIDEQDRQLGSKLHEHLPASPTGRDAAGAGNRQERELPLPRRDRCEHRRTLGTIRQAIRDVFHVAADERPPIDG
jgi:hypothetical protein